MRPRPPDRSSGSLGGALAAEPRFGAERTITLISSSAGRNPNHGPTALR
jgi:hypothetical protein